MRVAFGREMKKQASNEILKLVLKMSKSAVFSLVRQVIKYPNQLQVQVGVGYMQMRTYFNCFTSLL